MSPHIDKYPQSPFTQAIRLYGDRAGSKGTFRFAGLAWIHDTKVVLIHGDAQSLNGAAGWRCLLRLTVLAHRLKKPLILWNLPVVHIATVQRRTSLACAQAIQNAELELLKLPHPILTVFDEIYDSPPVSPEPVWNEGIVLVSPPDTQFSEHAKVKIAQHPPDIESAILELLCQVEPIPASELVRNRQEALRITAENRVAFSSNPSRTEEAPHV